MLMKMDFFERIFEKYSSINFRK